MATSASGSSTTSAEDVQSIFLTGVRNAHAVEKEARQLLERQIERLKNYPEVESLLRKHLDETNRHEQHMDNILEALGSDRSVLKDWVTQIMGNAAAMAHVPAGDEIIKDMLANHAFENFEAAAYKSLIVIAEAAGQSRFVPVLREILSDEERMARAVYEQIDPVTRTYLARVSSGQKADR